jgi:hypothetical protein
MRIITFPVSMSSPSMRTGSGSNRSWRRRQAMIWQVRDGEVFELVVGLKDDDVGEFAGLGGDYRRQFSG